MTTGDLEANIEAVSRRSQAVRAAQLNARFSSWPPMRSTSAIAANEDG